MREAPGRERTGAAAVDLLTGGVGEQGLQGADGRVRLHGVGTDTARPLLQGARFVASRQDGLRSDSAPQVWEGLL